MLKTMILSVACLAAACSTTRVDPSGGTPPPAPSPDRSTPSRVAPTPTGPRSTPVRALPSGARPRVRAQGPESVPVGTRLPPFTARAVELSGGSPRPVKFDSRRKAKVTAYLVIGTKCGATRAYAERMRALGDAYGRKGVESVYVYPNRDDTLAAKIAFHRERGFRGPLVDDRGAVLARRLGAQRTSTVILVDRAGRLFYRGALDDSRNPQGVKHRWVAEALDQYLAHQPVRVDHSTVHA